MPADDLIHSTGMPSWRNHPARTQYPRWDTICPPTKRKNPHPRRVNVFAQELGETPARHIERFRVDAARQLLEDPAIDYGEVARRCGFGGVNGMRRAFLRVLKVTPSDYRERFRAGR